MANEIVQYLAMFSGSFLPLSCGINFGWPSPYLPYLTSPSSPVRITSDEASWCAVAPLLGRPVGAFVGAVLTDKLGRKNLLLTQGPLIAACFLAMAFLQNIWMLLGMRFVIGAAEGIIYIALPIYYGEIASPKIRGVLGSSLSVSTVFGTLIVNVVGAYLDIFWSSVIFAVIAMGNFLTFLWMPESPYYLVKVGEMDAAKKSLETFRGVLDQDEFNDIKAAVKRQEATKRSSFFDLFTVKSNRKAMTIFFIITLSSKFTGMPPIIFYTVEIFKKAAGDVDPTLSVAIFYIVGLLAIIAAVFVIDRFGRRPLMLFSSLGCFLSLTSLASYFTVQLLHPEYIHFISWLPLASLLSMNFLFCLGLSFGAVLFLSELFPTSVKVNALGAGEVISVILATIASKLFEYLKESFGMIVPFWCFALCTIFLAHLIYFIVPETKGKTLEEIQLHLIGNGNKSKENTDC